MELSDSMIKKFIIFSQKKVFLIFQETELSYISAKENSEKVLYISENGTFFYFRKRKPRINSLFIRKQNFFIFQEEVPKPQKPKFFIFVQETSPQQIFLKILLNNSFHLFYKLNQTILLVYKTLKAFFCVESLFSF